MSTVKLSKAGKMPCKSWSLEAKDTCPASLDNKGELVDACKGCYASSGNYRFPNVKAPRIFNKENWKKSAWVSDMVAGIGKDTYFRWFDSGDMYSITLAKKILKVMKETPNTKHWLPTRMHKFEKFASVIAEMENLPNVVVRFSSDSVLGETIEGKNTSVIYPNDSEVPKGATMCLAYTQDGKCKDCRACWDKDVKIIAYPTHGATMKKVVRELIAVSG